MNKKIKTAVIWGDSLARGVILDENRNRYKIAPSTAATIIAEKTGISITNRSHMGMTSAGGKEMMKKDLSRGLSADVAIIEFGGNDCDFCWTEISNDPYALHLPKTDAAEFENNLREMITQAKAAGMVPVLCNLLPINAEKYFEFISQNGLSQENILKWLGDKFQIYRYQERYSMIINKIAHECGCRLFDIRSAFLNVWDSTTRLYCRDGIHPTAEGQELIGRAILREI